jgi:hypothetical protein
MTEDQLLKQRESLINDLNRVIEIHKTHIGCGLFTTDIIGVLETVKLDYYTGIREFY